MLSRVTIDVVAIVPLPIAVSLLSKLVVFRASRVLQSEVGRAHYVWLDGMQMGIIVFREQSVVLVEA